jgi:hypothetical protein
MLTRCAEIRCEPEANFRIFSPLKKTAPRKRVLSRPRRSCIEAFMLPTKSVQFGQSCPNMAFSQIVACVSNNAILCQREPLALNAARQGVCALARRLIKAL